MGIPIEQSFHEMTDHRLDEQEFAELLQRFRRAYKLYEEQSLTAFPHINEVLNTLQRLITVCFI